MTATTKTYQAFRRLAFGKGWTLAQLRCDVPPTDDILAAMDATGIAAWERFVTRLQREADANLQRAAFGGEYR